MIQRNLNNLLAASALALVLVYMSVQTVVNRNVLRVMTIELQLLEARQKKIHTEVDRRLAALEKQPFITMESAKAWRDLLEYDNPDLKIPPLSSPEK